MPRKGCLVPRAVSEALRSHERAADLGIVFALLAAMEQEPADKTQQQQEKRAVAQIERLVDAFADELQKLNESLQVLTAHLERLRTELSKEPNRLH